MENLWFVTFFTQIDCPNYQHPDEILMRSWVYATPGPQKLSSAISLNPIGEPPKAGKFPSYAQRLKKGYCWAKPA
jgi:hypothetical protein